MDSALWACELPEGVHDMFAEGAESIEVRVRRQRWGIFEKSCHLLDKTELSADFTMGGSSIKRAEKEPKDFSFVTKI